MKLPVIVFGVIAAVGVATTAGSYVTAAVHSIRFPDDRYSLLMEFNDDVSVLDHDLTWDDCMGYKPDSQPQKGLIFNCQKM